MPKEGKIRVLVAKPGLDGHDRGAKIVARALRDAGMEVIYTGIRQTPEMIVEAAIQEDVDVIGLSSHCMEHLGYASKIIDLLKEKKTDSIPIVLGGVIPKKDVPLLKAMGVKEVFAGNMTKDFAQAVWRLGTTKKEVTTIDVAR